MEQKAKSEPGVLLAEGFLKGAVSRERLIILPVKFWTDIAVFLERAYGPSISYAISKFAEEFGMRFVKEQGADGWPPSQVFETMQGMVKVAGWGDVKFTGDLESGKSIKVEAVDCAFCPSVRENLETKCEVLGGVAAGVAKVMFKKDYSADHVDVPGERGVKCVITLTERPERKRGEWESAAYFPWMLESQ